MTVDAPQRERILGIALRLMAEHGVHAMSMRQLASECGLNAATIYHYFPSKHALLEQVISMRRYDDLLGQDFGIDASLPAAQRLEALVMAIWDGMLGEDEMWRLLLGESLRGDPAVLTVAADLSARFEAALISWITALFPGDGRSAETSARVLRGLVFGFFIENLPLPAAERRANLQRRAREIAAVATPAAALGT